MKKLSIILFIFTSIFSAGVEAQNPRLGNPNINQQKVVLRPIATDKASEFIEAAKKHPSSPKFTNAIAEGSWTMNTAFGNLQLQSGPCYLEFKNGTLAKGGMYDGITLNSQKQESLVRINISGTKPGDWYFIKIQANLYSIDVLKIYSGENYTNDYNNYFTIKPQANVNQYPFTFQATAAESYMEMRGSGGLEFWSLASVNITKIKPQ